MSKTKTIFFGFVLILACLLFAYNSTTIEAATSSEVISTMFDKDGDGVITESEVKDADDNVVKAAESFNKIDLTNGTDKLTFIQGNGKDNEVAIKFYIHEFPTDATSFIVVESERTDSSTLVDADRYNKVEGTENTWEASASNPVKNGIAGNVAFSTGDDGKITAEITYRLRKGSFGLKFLRVYFYTAEISDTDKSARIDVVYVIAQPIDMVNQGATCSAKSSTEICIKYDENGATSRVAKDLTIYLPTSVAYKYSSVALTWVFDSTLNTEVVNNYSSVVAGSTIYGINYFDEDSNGTYPATDINDADRTYMYTNFTMSGLDTQSTTNTYLASGNYTLFLETFKANEIDYISTKVDAIGTFVYYIKDIFGNIKLIKQEVDNVKNRAIIVEVKKGNATVKGYNAQETFTNESVEVELTMTVETHFELGVCLDSKCTEVSNLTKDDVLQVKYWRVDVQFDANGVDQDAYKAGDAATREYAFEKHAAEGSMYNIYCKTVADCTDVQVYDITKKNSEEGAGFNSFEGNVLSMYVGVSGRYRFYIADKYGNNTLGDAGDRLEEEYRNPRVEVYSIDKAAPEITFEHDGEKTVGSETLKNFEIDTYEYYRGIELEANGGAFEYDGRIKDTEEAVEGVVDSQIYYPLNRDSGRSADVLFTDEKAILLSKVRVAEYIYYYSGNPLKEMYADYSSYDRLATDKYQKTLYDGNYYDNSIATILKNTKHNSDGLKLDSGVFDFKEINYYHKDGTTKVCEKVGTITGYESYASKTPLQCVNYYLDHGVDFIIEFVAEDSVGNIARKKVYVNVVDTTPAGFTLHTTEVEGQTVTDESKLVKSSNIGTDCRMEIGQEIGSGKTQNMEMLLNCYNVDLTETVSADNKYNFEDNVYNSSVNDGLSFYNTVNDKSHVKLYILSDRKDANNEYVWVDLSSQTFIPNKTGYYDLKIVIYDDADDDSTVDVDESNLLTIVVSYYVDRKIVLVKPVEDAKFYGGGDPTFDYCVYIDLGNHYDIRFSSNPYSNPDIFEQIYCTNQGADAIRVGKIKLFQQNTNSDFYGALSRLESSWYNANLATPILLSGTSVGVENNYVGLYRLILGTLNINLNSDQETADDDYIVKIHPSYRDDTKYKGTANDNKITNKLLEDDDKFAQSSIDFTIKQIVLGVSAAGGQKDYGQKDTNYDSYNDDDAENKYLGGFNAASVAGLINDGVQYNDTADIILGVLRREVGENVGTYKICNYRGSTNNDNVLESTNNMYLDCIDIVTPGVTFNDDVTNFEGYVYSNGILVIADEYVKSRALYIETNKTAAGKTLNTTTDSRNNKYANYVIKYSNGEYDINAIDLIIQAAPGQRREYNYTNTYDPNPWEIILYGLVDGSIKRVPAEEDETVVVTFNGFTADIIEGSYYEASPNEKDTGSGSEASKIAANFSEERTAWKLYIDSTTTLIGYKTNETYKLLRSTVSGSPAGSAKLMREAGKDGGWYLYYTLGNDLNIVGGTGGSAESKIAVITNGRSQCAYDTTGHIVTVGGETPCKNYNLIYNPYYTTEDDGYTIVNNPEGLDASNFVYKSNNKSCLTLDPDLPCANTANDNQKIYKIQFEIYRREIILEFNSAIETIKTSNTTSVDIFYGNRYNFFETNYFDIDFYTGKNFYPEDYLFLCYQNETSMARATFDPTNASSTGCTGDYRYGLTSGDSWKNVGLTFKLHEAVSATTSDYYDGSDYAIPAGVYYVYADIAQVQKKNYNFKYLGGALTIKSLAVEVEITSYLKEYGEKYYSKYGEGSDYSSFATLSECLLDGYFLNTNTNLVGLPEGVFCTDSTADISNTRANVYGFIVNGMDEKDTIAKNFAGRPFRNRSVTTSSDTNGLQDNVGTYTLKKGTIATINNNPFVNGSNACATQTVKGDYGSCVVVAGKTINNYVIAGETRIYTFNMHTTVEEEKDVDVATPSIPVVEGKVFIIPATLTITVTGSQTKMYGCAYNTYNNGSTIPSYSYISGYSDCEEGDGEYYDLGYKYTVAGDKDYQIARNGYEYTSNDSYEVSGIKGSDTFRPTTLNNGLKAHALNEGTLYRIQDTETNRTSVKMSAYVEASISAQKARDGQNKTYQGQIVGNYIITLGDLDATANEAKETYTNSCDANNMPGIGSDYKFTCKNYHIDYYGTKVYDKTVDVNQTYSNGGAFPAAILFTITKRTVYVYTNYDQKIYGESDMYRDSTKSAKYFCGDNNMDGSIDGNDEVTLEGGTVVNKDVYYGFCSASQVENNTDSDENNDFYIDYGLTRYYTKYNSLAKAPWNGIEGRNDVQADVITGQLSRKGMSGAEPKTDDIRGFYEYVYDNEDFFGTVHLLGKEEDDTSEYGYANYFVNYYENGLAVNADGENINDDEDQTPVKYEIVLRQIKIGFVSFDKTYGEKDVVTDYNILVCAPSEDFDFINMKCINKDPLDKHGLSDSHLNDYTSNGILDQSDFKNDFIVRFIRVLGENVSCGTSSSITVKLNGYFFGTGGEVTEEGTVYTKTLSCNTTLVDDKSVYETIAYIDQSLATVPGYNYQVSYQIGYVNIVPRPILITPDSGQGFTYGDYHDTLIPTITFKDSLVKVAGDGLVQTYGLVHSTTEGSSEGVCLNNINYYNNGTIDGETVGTCFYINDRMDEYNSGNSMTLSKYDASVVNSNTGLASVSNKNYVFGDVYETEGSVRSALNRSISTNTSTRYNRNVGIYTITLGDLKDQTGNYAISFTSGVTYEIKAAYTVVTPDRVSTEDVTGTSQSGQYKIYGEQDKEITFDVVTQYTVTSSHYSIYNSNIVKVVSVDNVEKTLAQLDRFSYSTETKQFTKTAEGTYIYLVKGDVVVLDGFAYGENYGASASLNYGVSKVGVKSSAEQKVNQGSVTGSLYYDTVCSGVDITVGCNADRTLSYGDTSRILLGYLYVQGWAQSAGVYEIVSGFKVAKNEWNNENYGLAVTSGVEFTIIPRPIGVQIENVNKVYGQTTDAISCEYNGSTMISPCSPVDGVLMEGNNLLKYNFSVVPFSGSTKIDSILNGGATNNSKLYSQNSKFVNGLVPESQKAYSAYGTAESKLSEHLGVYVSRDERNKDNDTCMYDGDTYGFCEDVGEYYLRFYGYLNTIDSIQKNDYQTIYKPSLSATAYDGLVSDVETYYYDSYFGYNPNYFVIVIDNDTDESAVTPDEIFSTGHTSTSRETDNEADYDKILKATGKLTITQKSIALYVNTSFFDEGLEVYYVGQNTVAPRLPSIDNSINLDYKKFNGIGVSADREGAVKGSNSYGTIIWGTQPDQVRTGDKLVGELAYCNAIIDEDTYVDMRDDGLTTDYACENLIYNDNKNRVNTNLIGYVPIVRSTTTLSIVSESATSANANYENNNYSVTFYPGALRIEEDNTKPVVEVNRSDVYIEANALGTYLYECVGTKGTTTYENCGEGISVVGKTDGVIGDPILNWLNNATNASWIVKVDLPLILGCEENEHDCTSTAYFQLMYGKGNGDFTDNGGITPGEEEDFLLPFTMQKDEYIKNAGPTSLKEMIITLVSWFGVTAYDEAEERNGELLDKKFDKYWYIVIEKQGTNGEFDIRKVGEYKVHFYVMDNAGNVSNGNMYEIVDEKSVLQTAYKNVGTLHIIDTTKPVVGTLNLYNGKVECTVADCTKEENWVVAEDTYLPLNILLKYDSNGNPAENGGYVDIGAATLSSIASLKKYSMVATNVGGRTYTEDSSQGKYVLISKGNKATALKHYSWSNSSSGIYLTITGGSDNSYTENDFPTKNVKDYSQWNHYFSRDGGITWFLFDKTIGSIYMALDSEGTREILIKAVDSGVKITSATSQSVSYTEKYYGSGNANNTNKFMTKYVIDDTSSNDTYLKTFTLMTEDEQKANDANRNSAIANVGWNVSDPAANDVEVANKISLLIYGIKATKEDGDSELLVVSDYKYYRDKRTAYLDRTSPVITFGENNGEKLYVYEFGCSFCTIGYEEKYAGAIDSYPENYTSTEIQSSGFNKNTSILLNHYLYEGTDTYQESYADVSQEKLGVRSSNGGLGGDQYAMNGQMAGLDIRSVYSEERRYIIYAFDKNDVRSVYDLSSSIPASIDSTDGEDSIYSVIKKDPNVYNTLGDYTYTIIYSVFDKAGNESAYIARGVIYANLIPVITADTNEDAVAQVQENGQNSYSLVVEQGENIEEVVNSLVIDAEGKNQFLSQTIYYNGELVVDNKKYNKNIYDGFTTSVPGVYEITYNLEYMYYGSDGQKELIQATPITLTITVEETAPIVETSEVIDYNSIVVIVSVLIASLAMCWFGFLSKKKI